MFNYFKSHIPLNYNCGLRKMEAFPDYVFDPGNDVAMSTTHNQMGNNAKQGRGQPHPTEVGPHFVAFHPTIIKLH